MSSSVSRTTGHRLDSIRDTTLVFMDGVDKGEIIDPLHLVKITSENRITVAIAWRSTLFTID